jgi:hypothetical protein
MNRRKFFGAVVGAGGMLGISKGSVRNTRTPNRFTQETKLGDYFFFWTGWKKSINVPVNVGQWIAEPVDEINLEFSRDYYEREHPAFYSATTGTNGALVNLNYVMDLTYQPGFPLITDKTSSEDKRKARDEALDRLVKYIESWEVPERQYVVASNSHMIHRENLKPGDLIPLDGMTMRALRKVVKHG